MLQMCSLKGRDVQGYPPEGIDECGPYPPTLKEVVRVRVTWSQGDVTPNDVMT